MYKNSDCILEDCKADRDICLYSGNAHQRVIVPRAQAVQSGFGIILLTCVQVVIQGCVGGIVFGDNITVRRNFIPEAVKLLQLV
jgi:hypothetical protein